METVKGGLDPDTDLTTPAESLTQTQKLAGYFTSPNGSVAAYTPISQISRNDDSPPGPLEHSYDPTQRRHGYNLDQRPRSRVRSLEGTGASPHTQLPPAYTISSISVQVTEGDGGLTRVSRNEAVHPGPPFAPFEAPPRGISSPSGVRAPRYDDIPPGPPLAPFGAFPPRIPSDSGDRAPRNHIILPWPPLALSGPSHPGIPSISGDRSPRNDDIPPGPLLAPFRTPIPDISSVLGVLRSPEPLLTTPPRSTAPQPPPTLSPSVEEAYRRKTCKATPNEPWYRQAASGAGSSSGGPEQANKHQC
jgi:hypothetical protein